MTDLPSPLSRPLPSVGILAIDGPERRLAAILTDLDHRGLAVIRAMPRSGDELRQSLNRFRHLPMVLADRLHLDAIGHGGDDDLLSPHTAVLLENGFLLTGNRSLREFLTVTEWLNRVARNEFGQPSAGADTPADDEWLDRIAVSEMPVLILGETGAGKEVTAREICGRSARRDSPFVKVNCAALPSELIESELFGHDRGAFTGAATDRVGRFEQAHKGTLFLDEIGDMDLGLQTRLLQVLQDMVVYPLGSTRAVPIDVRVIAATHRNLDEAVANGSFREDLYYRLNVIRVTVPALRDRPLDILPLARKLLAKHLRPGQTAPVIDRTLEMALRAHQWPGNVRELENVMRRLIVFQDSRVILRELEGGSQRAASLKPAKPSVPSLPEKLSALDRIEEHSRKAEMETILRTLNANSWSYRKAAAELRVDYKAFLYRLKKFGISKSSSRSALPHAS